MSFNQEVAYIQTMASAAEKTLIDAGKPELARQVETLFAPPANPDRVSDGAGEFMDAADAVTKEKIMALASSDKFQDDPFFVEEMMVKELRNHRIEVPPTFMAAAKTGKLTGLAESAKQRP